MTDRRTHNRSWQLERLIRSILETRWNNVAWPVAKATLKESFEKRKRMMTKVKAEFLYIISRERPDLYRRVSAEFADLPQVTVIVDRRVGRETPMHERRTLPIDEDLETLGGTIVPL